MRKINKIEKLCYCGCGRMVTRYPSQDSFYFEKACWNKARVKQGIESSVCAECKEEKSLSDFRLKSGSLLRNCYCRECQNKIISRHKSKLHSRWVAAKNRANKKRSGWWSLSEEEYGLLLLQRCHYCGKQLEATGVGLDRKNNDLGYIADNVVPCCKRCNIIKNNHFTYEEMMVLSPSLQQIQRETHERKIE